MIVHIIFSFLLSPLPFSPNYVSGENCSASFLCTATEDQQQIWDKTHPVTVGVCFTLSGVPLSHTGSNNQGYLLERVILAGVSGGNVSGGNALGEP